MGALQVMALQKTITRLVGVSSNAARMSIFLEALPSFAESMMVVIEPLGRMSDNVSAMSHCPFVAATVAYAAPFRHPLTAAFSALPDSLARIGKGYLSQLIFSLPAMVHDDWFCFD